MSSLIGLSPNDNSRQQRSGSCSPPTPAAVVGSRMAPHNPSPNVSVGLPAPPHPTAAAGGAPPVAPAGLYPFLLHPGLYQHLITGMNPMLLNAQIQALNPLLYAGGHGLHPGLLQVQQAAATAERLRSALASTTSASGSTGSSHRYSPYPLPSPPASSSLSSLGSPTGAQTSSAFSAVKKSHSELKSEKSKSPEPVKSDDVKTEAKGSELKSELKNEPDSEHPLASDIKSMEKLVNGLNGSSASKFGISHNNNDQQISA